MQSNIENKLIFSITFHDIKNIVALVCIMFELFHVPIRLYIAEYPQLRPPLKLWLYPSHKSGVIWVT